MNPIYKMCLFVLGFQWWIVGVFAVSCELKYLFGIKP